MAINDSNLFPQLFEDSSHAQFAAQRVAIGPYVAGKDKSLVGLYTASEQVPIQGHNVANSAEVNGRKYHIVVAEHAPLQLHGPFR